MFLIVGLGNPGDKYRGTRHNVGFEVVELLAEQARTTFSERKFKSRLARARIGDSDCWLQAPQTYMNLSGEAVGPALGFYKLSTAQVVVVHDDLDIELGRLKLKQGGGHGGHNGLRSLISHLPDANFIRVRIGIGRPPPGGPPADSFVLTRFSKEDRATIDEAVTRAASAVETIVRDGVRRAMTEFNRTEAKQAEDREADEGDVVEKATASKKRVGDDNGQHA